MNLPNKITLSRIFMIPVFVAVFFLDSVLPDVKGMPIAYAIAAAIFAILRWKNFIFLIKKGCVRGFGVI